jgi:membrane protease YdiL (CAAX protease family)
MASVPHLRTGFAIAAIGFAPFAGEYLFRGLLYRALDREWGGWLAVVGSAVFFAIYHPPLSWLPVMCVGVANALRFRTSERLAPAVVLHMVYNAVVLLGKSHASLDLPDGDSASRHPFSLPLQSKSVKVVLVVIRFALIEPVNVTVTFPEVSYALNTKLPV